MIISDGFRIDHPDLFIPWGIDEKTLTSLFKGHLLRPVSNGYHVAWCTSFTSLHCMLGFHFHPYDNGVFSELEFFREEGFDLSRSFNEFQVCMVNAFGAPVHAVMGKEGFMDYEWRLGDIRIVHSVVDRMGPAEHLRIRKLYR